jgi:peptide/nickel transport system substrate-binding protein
MKKRIIWPIISCLMILSLVIASCGTKENEEAKVTEEGGQVITTKGEAEEGVGVEEEGLLPPEVPKYGGTLTNIGSDVAGWDTSLVMRLMMNSGIWPIYEPLITDDWTKGPAGTHEVNWTESAFGMVHLYKGCLAESWELKDDGTVVFHIRKGVHFQNVPPVNGREFTAEDARWNFERVWASSKTYHSLIYASGKPISYNVPDKYTLEVKFPVAMQGMMLIQCGAELEHYPPDMVKQYGDMSDWKYACGTGPFMIQDYVPAVSLTYIKNQNYWQYDPFHTENQLPYYDVCKMLIIQDISTQLAAFRTGKLDVLGSGAAAGVSIEDYKLLLKTNPQLKYLKKLLSPTTLWGREDKTELPFKDIKVRQALNLAINRQELVDQYYQGESQVSVSLYPPIKECEPFYTPLEELPTKPTIEGSECSVQEIFSYNPEKARNLLAEAGYPNGFKTNIVCGFSPDDADFLSIIREYFLDIGVDMEIKPLEASVFTSVMRGKSHEQMIFFPIALLPQSQSNFRIEHGDDFAYWEHPHTREAYNQIVQYIGRDDDKWITAIKDVIPFILEEAIGVWLPPKVGYTIWQPWVQNYQGESLMGTGASPLFLQYLWIDQALKTSMGY